MNPIEKPRGTRDILPDEQPYWEMVTAVAAEVSSAMGFRRIDTPTYEARELFKRAIGGGTDVMDKELFLVRGVRTEAGAEEYVLRPEGTAGMVRAYVENGMHVLPQPVKLWSIIRNFRYDRPQRGRYREHVQWTCEIFGERTPFLDAWTVYASWRFLKRLRVNAVVKMNTLGTAEERAAYTEALRLHLSGRESGLSEESLSRLQSNPLRILDSKDEADRAALNGGPELPAYLSEASRLSFEAVLGYLDAWGVPYERDARLVRGLDYYAHTAFEWTVAGGGQQAALGGGGRYDGLVEQLGGQPGGAVGFGIGLDRVVEYLHEAGADVPAARRPDAFVIAADGIGQKEALGVIARLLDAGLAVDSALSKGSVGAQLKSAGKARARFAVVAGEREAAQDGFAVRDLDGGSQELVKRGEVEAYLLERR